MQLLRWLIKSMHCRPIDGIDTAELVTHHWNKHGMIATPIKRAEIEGLRVAANLFATLKELNRCRGRFPISVRI